MLGKEQLRGHLDLLVLSVLSRASAHGYEIIKTLEQRGEGSLELKEGTLYPALYRLEARGLVRSTREAVGGRTRRVYHLTEAGGHALADEQRRWSALTSFVGAVLEGN